MGHETTSKHSNTPPNPTLPSRRNFLKQAGIGALTTAGFSLAAPLLSSCSLIDGTRPDSSLSFSLVPESPINFKRDCDILIVGSGIAGFCAAIDPLRAGKKVLMVEKLELLGGSSYKSSGVLKTSGSKIQTNTPEETLTALWNERLTNLSAQYDPAFINQLKEVFFAQARWVDMLVDTFNIEFLDCGEYLSEDLKNRYLIPKNGLGDNDSLMITLRDELSKKGLTTITKLAAQNFIVDSNHKVSGMRFYSPQDGEITDIFAQKIIMCTGGFIANQELVHFNLEDWQYCPCIDVLSLGEGLRLGKQLRASLKNMKTKPLLSPDVAQAFWWPILSNSLCLTTEGKRFINEDIPGSAPDSCFREQQGSFWILVDESLMKSPLGPSIAKSFAEFKKRGFGPYDDLDSLSKETGIPLDNLQSSVQDFNNALREESQDVQGRKRMLHTLDAPYWAMRLMPARFESIGGVEIDVQGHALDTNGAIIENVYYAGAASNLSFDGLASAGTLGWIAGSTATTELEA